MKKISQLSIILSALLFFAFGCSIFSSAPMEPVPVSPQAPAQEQAAPPTPTSLPETTALLPSGVLTEKDGAFTFFDRDGYTIIQFQVAGLSHADPSNTQIAGAVPAGGTNIPLIYYSFSQNNALLFNTYGQATTLRAAPNFSGLAGAPGEAIIAYTTAEYSDDGLIANLYIGSAQSLPTSEPVLSDIDPQGWALVALAVDMEGDQPVGIWYSKRPWGIGGDIVFDPRRTLSYLDLRGGTAYQYLGAEENPSALSADRHWVAYSNDTSVGAGVGSMATRNFFTGENISFPLQAAVDQRGAGEASFSPNNQYLAWMEASGWLMAETPNFHSVVRVGNLNGNIVAEFADTALLGISGMSAIQRVEPVGWLDDNTLVIMARGEKWNDAVLIAVDVPSQSTRFLAYGVFVGFTYP